MSYITHAVKEKIDRVANVIVQMERGEYEFPDGKPRWRRDAEGNRRPRVVQGEAVRHVWDGKENNKTLGELFSPKGRYYHLLQERIAFHRQRLDEGYRQALATLTDDGNALAIMSDKLYQSLWWDLNDEETCRSIPFKERARFFEVLTKMEASVKGDVTTQADRRLRPSVVIQQINVPDSVKERMMANTSDDVIELEVVGE